MEKPERKQKDLAQILLGAVTAAVCIRRADGLCRFIKLPPNHGLGFLQEGKPAAELWKRYVQTCVHPDDRARAEDLQARIESKAGVTPGVVYLRSVNHARERWLAWGVIQIQDEVLGECRLLYTREPAAAEVAEWQEAEREKARLREEQRSNEEKNAFSDRLAYDMRQTLNMIMGLSRVALSQKNDPDKMIECLRKILTGGENMVNYLNDVMDFSRIDSGSEQAEDGEFNLVELMQQVAAQTEEQLSPRALEFRLHKEGTVHTSFRGDKARLHQLLTHLFTAAAQSTEGGQIRLSVRELTVVKDTAQLQLSVWVPERGAVEKWQRELRGAGAAPDSPAETALLLPLARQLARVIGAKLDALPAEDGGSRCVVILTLQIPSQRWETGEETEPEDLHAFAGRRILVVEDNEMNSEIACSVLEMYHLKTETAQNGKQAVEMFLASGEGYYSAILMDMRMPIMDGVTAAGIIRTTKHPQARFIPILAVTADTDNRSVQAIYDAGMNACLAKPLDVAQLYRELRAAFEKEKRLYEQEKQRAAQAESARGAGEG